MVNWGEERPVKWRRNELPILESLILGWLFGPCSLIQTAQLKLEIHDEFVEWWWMVREKKDGDDDD